MTHIMIDLETLSTRMNAVIIEVGYCLFEPTGDGVDFSATFRLDVEEQIDTGRSMTWKTIQWWMKQDEAARMKIADPQGYEIFGIEAFLDEFSNVIPWGSIEGVWSHGAGFDIPILTDLYASAGLKEPWHYRTPRDTRTLFSLSPMEMVPATMKHSAEADAIAQALTVQKSFKALQAKESS